jgi:hypothetical protein
MPQMLVVAGRDGDGDGAFSTNRHQQANSPSIAQQTTKFYGLKQ